MPPGGINGEGLTIFGAGSATRDYLYQVTSYWARANLVLRTQPLRGQAINFASGKDTRVRTSSVCCGQVRCQDRARGCFARKVSAFPLTFRLPKHRVQPQVEIWDGIDRYINWAKDQPQYPYEQDGFSGSAFL